MSILLEACVGCYKEAKKAELQGADRIELCDNLGEGGTTTSYGTIYLATQNINIPIAVIIRPRGGDFVYSNDEFEIMKKDIKLCKEIGVETVVFGILNKDNTIDIERTRELVELSNGLKITFHMAFDEIDDKFAGNDFLRIHQSFLVNMKFIKNISRYREIGRASCRERV